MDPNIAALLRTELLGDEGKVLRAYDDATGKVIGPGTLVRGNVTIGIGRNLIGNGISEDECEFLFANDSKAAQSEVLAALPWVAQLSPARQVVMFSLHFNMSLHNINHFLHGWPNFIAQMQAGQFDAAATNLASTQPWAGEVGPRATRLANFVRVG